MSSVCESPSVPVFNSVAFNGAITDITSIVGLTLVGITPDGSGLTGVLQGIDNEFVTVGADIATIQSDFLDVSGMGADEIMASNGASVAGFINIPSGSFVGNDGSGVEAIDATEAFAMLGVTASAAELNIMDGVTASTAEINFLVGVTSLVQTQLDDTNTDITKVKNAVSASEVDFVVTGLTFSTTGGLTADVIAGTAVVNGFETIKVSATNNTYTASKDTYVYMDEAGAFTYLEVAVAGPEPAQPANTVKLGFVTTDGSSVTATTDQRPLFPITDAQLAADSVTTIKIADDAVTAAKLDNTAVTPGAYTAADITVDENGRVTAASSNVIPGAAVSDKNYTEAVGAVATAAITHSLAKYPAVTIIDASGNEVDAEIIHNTVNDVTINFTPSFTGGTAIFN